MYLYNLLRFTLWKSSTWQLWILRQKHTYLFFNYTKYFSHETFPMNLHSFFIFDFILNNLFSYQSYSKVIFPLYCAFSTSQKVLFRHFWWWLTCARSFFRPRWIFSMTQLQASQVLLFSWLWLAEWHLFPHGSPSQAMNTCLFYAAVKYIFKGGRTRRKKGPLLFLLAESQRGKREKNNKINAHFIGKCSWFTHAV